MFSTKHPFLFDKSLDFLFEYFNSDKAEKYINQYTHPSKKTKIKIQAHGYSRFYRDIFYPIRNKVYSLRDIHKYLSSILKIQRLLKSYSLIFKKI